MPSPGCKARRRIAVVTLTTVEQLVRVPGRVSIRDGVGRGVPTAGRDAGSCGDARLRRWAGSCGAHGPRWCADERPREHARAARRTRGRPVRRRRRRRRQGSASRGRPWRRNGGAAAAGRWAKTGPSNGGRQASTEHWELRGVGQRQAGPAQALGVLDGGDWKMHAGGAEACNVGQRTPLTTTTPRRRSSAADLPRLPRPRPARVAPMAPVLAAPTTPYRLVCLFIIAHESPIAIAHATSPSRACQIIVCKW